MLYNPDKIKKVVLLGVQGENLVTKIEFDMSAWAELYSNGSYSILLQRPTEVVSYNVNTTYNPETKVLTWLVSSIDTAIEGEGYAEVICLEGDKIDKSTIFDIYVDPCLNPPGPVPDPYEDWYQRMLEAEANTKQYRDESEEAADNAVLAKDDAISAKNVAVAAQEQADQDVVITSQLKDQVLIIAQEIEGDRQQILTNKNDIAGLKISMETYGKSLVVSIDSQTYVMTMLLKDANGNTLSTQSVDLPLETMVVGGDYDNSTKSLILTLKNGNIITIPVADLVSGLVNETQLATILGNYATKAELSLKQDKSNLVVEINDTTPSDTKYPSEKAVVDYVGQIANEESVNVSDNVLIKISGVSDNLALPPESQMEVNSIEGNSVVVNQLVPIISTKTTNGVTLTNNGDGSYTLNGTATTETFFYLNKIDNINGHKIFIGFANLNTAVEGLELLDGNSGIGSTGTKILVNWTYSDNFICDIKVSNGTTLNNVVVRPFFIDLTQWFGSNDNIPQDILNTPSNFFKHYKGSLAYDTGHIENGSGDLVDTNRNIWDEEWGNYIWDETNNGIRRYDNACFGCNDFINVSSNTTYYFRSSTSLFYILFYDNNKNYLSHIHTESNRTFNTPANCRYITFYSFKSYGTTYKHDICINVSGTNFNGTYVSHIKNTLNFGNDTLRSAGKARDKKTPDGTITRRVGMVDLGTLNWEYNPTYTVFLSSNISDLWYSGSGSTQKMICSKYAVSNVSSSDSPDKTIYPRFIDTEKTLGVKDSNYTDAATFKAAMSGVILNYELATPIIEQGTPYDNYIPVYYGGQEFTTGDVPFVINKNYDISIKDQVITNVRVDKEQSEQIHALENVNREQSNRLNNIENEVNDLETGCYTLGTVNSYEYTTDWLIGKVAEHFDKLKDSQRVRIYVVDDLDLARVTKETREFKILKTRYNEYAVTTYTCDLIYDEYTIYRINLYKETSLSENYSYNYSELRTQLKKDLDNIQASITGALTEDY